MRTVPRWTRIYLGGYSFANYTQSIGPLEVNFAEADLTTLGDAVKGALPGQPTANIGTLNAVMDNDTNGFREIMQGGSNSWPTSIAIGMQAEPAAGNPVFAGYFRQKSYTGAASGELVTVSAEFEGWDAAASNLYQKFWGKVLHANSAETAVNSGSGVDSDTAAATTTGGFAIFHLLSSNGTVTLTVQDSADNSTGWANVTGLTSGVIDASSTPTAVFAATAVTATIKRYTRWQLSFGTASTATFLISFVR